MTVFLVLLGVFALITFLAMLFSPAEAWWPETTDHQSEDKQRNN